MNELQFVCQLADCIQDDDDTSDDGEGLETDSSDEELPRPPKRKPITKPLVPKKKAEVKKRAPIKKTITKVAAGKKKVEEAKKKRQAKVDERRAPAPQPQTEEQKTTAAAAAAEEKPVKKNSLKDRLLGIVKKFEQPPTAPSTTAPVTNAQ